MIIRIPRHRRGAHPSLSAVQSVSCTRDAARRRIAFVVLTGIAVAGAAAACSSARDPEPAPSPSPSRSPSSGASTTASGAECGPKSPGLLHVMNMYGVPLEIRMAQGNGPGVRIAAAPAGATSVKVEGPADQAARYDVVNPKGERPTQRLVSVSWRRPSAAGPSSSRSIHMELRCAPTGGQ